jgi:O-antigen/teichoic acid export membrane protein
MFNKTMVIVSRCFPSKWRWIFQHEGIRRYSANAGWLLFGQISSAAISFVISVLVARQLGPASYGLLNYVISFITLFGFIASLGIYDIVKREFIGQDKQQTDKLLGTGWILCILGAVLAIICLILVLLIIRQDWSTSRLVILFSLIFLLQSFAVIDLFFQAKVQSGLSAWGQIGGTIVRSIGLVVCLLANWPLIYLVLAYLLGSLANQLILLFYYRRYGSCRSWSFDVNLAKKILQQSWPLILSSASLLIYARLDQLLVRNLISDAAAGFYAVAVKLSEIWYFIPTLLVAAVFPALVAARQSDLSLYRQRWRRLSILFIVLSIGLAGLLSVFSNWLIGSFFGSQYLAAVPAMLIYNWTAVGFFLAVILNNYFIIEQRTRWNFLVNGSAAIANIVFNLLLIPRLGIIGAAWATIVSYFVLLVVGFLAIKLSKNYVR